MEGEWTTRKSANWKTGKLNCKNIYKTILSRVRARTHHRSFCFFAVTSVTRKLYFTGFQLIADILWINVNNEVIRVGLVRGKRYRKSRFSSCVSLNFSAIFCLSFSRRVTLVTAKKQHRCWKARARTHTYEKTTHNDFARLAYQFSHIYKIICQFFVVFSLFGTISPHIHIGSKQMKRIAKKTPSCWATQQKGSAWNETRTRTAVMAKGF